MRAPLTSVLRRFDCTSCTEVAYRRTSQNGHLSILHSTALFAPKTPKFIQFLPLHCGSLCNEDTWCDPLISVLRRSDYIYFYFIDFTEKVHDEEDLQQEPAESVVRIAT